jgi:hypothetical protein
MRLLRRGCSTYELPVATRSTRPTKIGITSTSWELLYDLFKLYFALRRSGDA